MLKKHVIAIGILLSLILLVIATRYYPGGSPLDKESIGFAWGKNFISDLFGEKALNDVHNSARFWAMASMITLSLSFAIFFISFSRRIPNKSARNVIKFFGGAGMIFTSLIATPLHDLMVTIASTLFLLCMFYITVFVFRSKLHLFKLLCVIYLVIFYGTLIIFGSSYFIEYLPIIQKVLFSSTILLMLGLNYFTKKEDFQNGSLQRNLRNVE